jgi:hypothetical protein
VPVGAVKNPVGRFSVDMEGEVAEERAVGVGRLDLLPRDQASSLRAIWQNDLSLCAQTRFGFDGANLMCWTTGTPAPPPS